MGLRQTTEARDCSVVQDQQQALFDSILEGVHETLEDDTETARARASINDGELLHQLRMQAEGAEAAQDMAAAARYHLERCTSASDDVQVTHEADMLVPQVKDTTKFSSPEMCYHAVVVCTVSVTSCLHLHAHAVHCHE